MEKLRYNRAFKSGMTAILFLLALCGAMVSFFVVAKIQYDQLVDGMKPLEATIVDIDLDKHIKGQKITIEYAVDGVVYNRKLGTDTVISFAAGKGAHYSVGDKVEIYYDPQDPQIIASPRSIGVGAFCAVIGGVGLALGLFALVCVLKTRKRFLVTVAEYEKEGEEIKRSKQKEKERKKKLRLERKKQHPRARKAGKIALIVLASLVGAFVLFLLLGALLRLK